MLCICEVRRSRSSIACHRNSAKRLATCDPTLGYLSSSFLMQNSQQKCQMGHVQIIAEHKPQLKTQYFKPKTDLKAHSMSYPHQQQPEYFPWIRTPQPSSLSPSGPLVTLTRTAHSRFCKALVFPLWGLLVYKRLAGWISTQPPHLDGNILWCWDFSTSNSQVPSLLLHSILRPLQRALVDTQRSPDSSFILSTVTF